MSTRSAGPGPVVGHRAWLGGLAALIGIVAGLHSLTSIVQPGSWTTAATFTAAAVLLAAAATRTMAPPEWAPVSALAAGALAVVVGYGGENGPALPGSRTVENLGDLLDQGAAAIREGVIPVVPTRGIELFIVIGAAAAAVAVDALALSVRTVGAAGIALAALWTPTLMFEVPPTASTVAVAAGAWVMLAWVSRPPRGPDRGPWRELPGVALLATAVAVLAVVVGPLATSLPGYGSVRLPAMWGADLGAGSIGLSQDLDLRRDLGQRPTRPVLRYTTTVEDLGPLRTATLMTFDGVRWSAGDGLRPRTAVGLLWPQDAEQPAPSEAQSLRVEVLNLEQRNLPIPLEPRELVDGQPWGYDEQRDEVTGGVAPGVVYEMSVLPRDVSADTLRGDRARPVDPGADELQVPQTPFTQRIADLAREVTAGQGTTYDKALALQTWFRGGGGFRYDTELAPARTQDPLWDFLQSKRGYCVQYATAMAVMARELGIPSRVGVGFLPGKREADGSVTVSADRAHAWPELWFDQAGWVRFEPTPATQTGLPPRYADPFANQPSATPSMPDVPEATASAGPNQQPQTPGGSVTQRRTGLPLLVWAAIGAGVAAIAAGMVVLVRRRRRDQAWGPEEAWAVVGRAARDSDVHWAVGSTPRQAGRELRRALRGQEPAQAAVAQLVRAVEDHRYAPNPTERTPEELHELADQVTGALSAARRDAAPSAPRSG